METDPIPDEYCPHVAAGTAEMTGGWYFAARVPPVAVGMCHECIVWCQNNLSAAVPWPQHVQEQREEDDRILSADVLI